MALAIAALVIGTSAYFLVRQPKPKPPKSSPRASKLRGSRTSARAATSSKTGRRSGKAEVADKTNDQELEYEKFNSEEIRALLNEERISASLKLKNRGNEAYKLKDYAKAIELYTKAIEFHPDPVFYSNRAACYFNDKQYVNVIEDCNEALRMDCHYIKALNRRGAAYEQLQQYREALNDYTASCILDSFSNEQFASALDRVAKTIAQTTAHTMMQDRPKRLPPFKYITKYFDSFSITDKNHPLVTKSREELEEELADNNGDIAYEKALFHMQERQYLEAMHAFEKAVQLGCSNMAEAYEMRGTFAYLQGNREAALNDFEEVIKLKPEFVRAYIKRASVYMELYQFDKVVHEFEHAIKINPSDANIYYHRGQVNLLTNKFEDAIKDYKHSIKLCSDFLLTHLQLGFAQYRSSDQQAGIATIEKCLEQFPNSCDAHTYLGELLVDQQQFDKAIHHFNKAVGLQKDDAAPYVNLALLSLQRQDLKQAEELCHKALAADPDSDVANNAMGHVLITQNKVEDALHYIEKTLELARTEEELMHQLQFAEVAKAQLVFLRNYPDRSLGPVQH